MDFVWNGDAVIDAVNQRIDQQAHQIGNTFVGIAQRYAPKRTGRLASSIGYAYNPSTHTIQFLVGAPYGVFVEFGTRHSMPHPFMRPALNTVGTIWGFETELVFQNTIHTDMELLAHGPTYQMGKGLTERQKHHVRHRLKPVSQRHHIGNVSRARLRVEHSY